jgi:hypothetical protein
MIINNIWILIKKFLFDYKLLKYIDWKKRQHKFIKNVIPKIPIIDILEHMSGYDPPDWYFCSNYGYSVKQAVSPIWRADCLHVGCILSLPIKKKTKEEDIIVNRHYFVAFYNINNISDKYL